MEHYVEKKGNVWIPRQEPINGRNIGHKVVCERLGAYEASEMTPGAVIAMKRACGGKTAAEIEALMQAESEGRLYIAPCPNGTPIFCITSKEMIGLWGKDVNKVFHSTYKHGSTEYHWGEFGKRWFLSETAALAAKEGERE